LFFSFFFDTITRKTAFFQGNHANDFFLSLPCFSKSFFTFFYMAVPSLLHFFCKNEKKEKVFSFSLYSKIVNDKNFFHGNALCWF
jgi:hypothetical protein